jgi:LAGLIDADG DNA endonuclease family protein
VTGLIQSDGFFGISVKNVDYGSGLYIKPYLSIELHADSLFLLQKVQSYFGCGRLNIRKDRKICIYEISNIHELWHILIPHFYKFPFFGFKQVAFIRFIQALSLLYPYIGNKKSPFLLGKVIYLMSILNPINKRSTLEIENYYNKLGLNKKDKEDIIRSINSDFNSNYFIYKILSETHLFNINMFFIIGIIEGDGSFYFGLRQNKKMRFGFNITTHILELDLMYAIKFRLNCGNVKIKSKT